MFVPWFKHFPYVFENSKNSLTWIQVPNHINPGTIYYLNEFLGTKLSLPGIAFNAKYNLFPQTLPYVYSFTSAKNQHNNEYDGEYVRELFRSFLIGGISNIYHRFALNGTENGTSF